MLSLEEVAERALRSWRSGVALSPVKWEFSERHTLDKLIADVFALVEVHNVHVEYLFLSQRIMAQAVFRGAYDTSGSMAILDDSGEESFLWGARVSCLPDLPDGIFLVVGGDEDGILLVAVGEVTYPPDFPSPVPG